MVGFFLQALGWMLVGLALADVFLTVLHTRGDAAVLSTRLNRGLWWLVRGLSGPAGKRREAVRGFAGPLALVLTVAMWVALVTLGFALIALPDLGTEIRSPTGHTPSDFFTAIYYSGMALTTLGLGDFMPETAFTRFALLMEALLGFSMVTLSLTYFLSIYNALIRRNAFAAELHYMSARSGDAAELLVRIGSAGKFGSDARTGLATVARELLTLLQTHHAYPVIHMFVQGDIALAPARVALLSLDTASLVRSALDADANRDFIESAAIEVLWDGGLQLLIETGRDILSDADREASDVPHERGLGAPLSHGAGAARGGGLYRRARRRGGGGGLCPATAAVGRPCPCLRGAYGAGLGRDRARALPGGEPMKAWRYDAEGRDEEIEATAETLAGMGEHCLLWIELQTPDREPLEEAARILGLDDGSVDEVLDPELTPRIDNYGGYYQVSLLTAPGVEKAKESHRLDMLVGEKWVLTVHKGPLEFFEAFRAQDKAETMIGAMSGPSLAASLLDWHLAAFFQATADVEAAVDRLDDMVLTHPNSRPLLGRMVTLRRRVSKVRSRLAAQRQAFYGLARPDFAIVAQSDASAHYQALAQRFDRALDEVERARDLVVGSFELMNSRTSLQTNELVKLLTVVTVIIGFCGAVAGVFGMNIDGDWMKLGNTGFAVTVGGMLVFSIAALVAAKLAKWF